MDTFSDYASRFDSLAQADWTKHYLQCNSDNFVELKSELSGLASWLQFVPPNYGDLLLQASRVINNLMLLNRQLRTDTDSRRNLETIWRKIDTSKNIFKPNEQTAVKIDREILIAQELLYVAPETRNAVQVVPTPTMTLSKEEAPSKELSLKTLEAFLNKQIEYKRLELIDGKVIFKGCRDPKLNAKAVEAYFTLHPTCVRLRVVGVSGADKVVIITRTRWESFGPNVTSQDFNRLLAEAMKDNIKTDDVKDSPDEIGIQKK